MIITGKIDINEIDRINRRLIDHYGRGPNDLPYFRVVWAGDQYEKRLMTHTDEGLLLLHPQVRQVPKYWIEIRNKYVLESLTIVPDYVDTDLVDKLVYEPKWVFEDNYGMALYPRWDAINMVLQTVRVNMEQAGRRPTYKDPDVGENSQETALIRKARIDKVEEDLFGDDTPISDALHQKSGIVVP